MTTITLSNRMTRTMLSVLLVALPLSAYSYERGALAPKDPPLMPTVIVYSGASDTSESSPAPSPNISENKAPTPTNAPAPAATPVEPPAPAPQAALNSSTTTSPSPPPLSPAAAPIVIAPNSVTPNTASTTSPASIRHHIGQLLLLIMALALIGALIWWFRRPYTPPHARRKADPKRDLDIDLDFDN